MAQGHHVVDGFAVTAELIVTSTQPQVDLPQAEGCDNML